METTEAAADRQAAAALKLDPWEIRRRNAAAHPDGARFQDELARSLANLAILALDADRGIR